METPLLTSFFSAITVTWSIGKVKERGSHWSIGSCRSRSDHSQDHSHMEMVQSSAFQGYLISGVMSALLFLEVCWRLGKEEGRFNIRTQGIKTG